MKFEKSIESPLGLLTLESDGTSLNALRFGKVSQGMPSCPVLEQAETELKEYFAGKRREFSIPLSASGTAFQNRVWEELKRIPYGETVSYAELAARIGNPKACRAVGGANHRNPLPIVVPCHRVVGKNGVLTGYALGLPVKAFLLELEREGKRSNDLEI